MVLLYPLLNKVYQSVNFESLFKIQLTIEVLRCPQFNKLFILNFSYCEHWADGEKTRIDCGGTKHDIRAE